MTWLVLDLTGSALALGIVAGLQLGPVLAFGLIGGVLADRWPRRWLLLVSQCLRALLALGMGLLVIVGAAQLWHLCIMAALIGLSAAADRPARQAFLADLVSSERLPAAVAFDAAVLGTAGVVGPAIGGLAVALVGVGSCFLLNALSFLPPLLVLLALEPARRAAIPSGRRESVATQVREGLSYARRSPPLAAMLLLMAALGTFGFNFNLVLPLLARFALGAGALGFGALSSALALGSLSGSLLTAGRVSARPGWVIAVAAGFALLLPLPGLSPSFELTLALLFGIGLLAAIFVASANASLQVLTPDRLRGRMAGLAGLLTMGGAAGGALFTMLLADLAGVQVVLAVSGACAAVGVGLALLVLRFAAQPAVSLARPPAAP